MGRDNRSRRLARANGSPFGLPRFGKILTRRASAHTSARSREQATARRQGGTENNSLGFFGPTMPNSEQARDLRRFAGSCWFVLNKTLALQKARCEAGGRFIGCVVMARLLTEWRQGIEMPCLKQAPVHSFPHALNDLERTYSNFFANLKAGASPASPRFQLRRL